MGISSAKSLFNPQGDTDKNSWRMIGGDTTNLNDFNNMKYIWASSRYRQAMNNFWIPEEINLSADLKDYKNLTVTGRIAYDKVLGFLAFLDPIQTANLPCTARHITANEVNLCLTIQGFQEAVHSQNHNYMPDSICSPVERDRILYQWKEDEHPLCHNTSAGNLYNEFQEKKDDVTLLRVIMTNYILEGIYFYSGLTFFYNLGRGDKMPGSVQKIRYINRDENTHLWLPRSMIVGPRKEEPQLFASKMVDMLRSTLEEDVAQKIQWGCYVIGDDIPGPTREMVTDYIRYLGNLRWNGLGFDTLYEGYDEEPQSVKWVNQYSNANMARTDFLEAENTAYAESAAIVDDLQIKGYNGAGIPTWEAVPNAASDAGTDAGVGAWYPTTRLIGGAIT